MQTAVRPAPNRPMGFVLLAGIRREHQLVALLWFVYLVAFPLYLAPSGLPQLSTVIVFTLFVAIVGRHVVLARADIPVLAALAQFVVYAWAVGVVWAILLAHPLSLAPGVFYTFNALLMGAILHLAVRIGRRRLHHLTLLGVLVALAWQLAYWLVAPGTGLREHLLFNNPNQLGYYGLLAAILFALPASAMLAGRWRAAGLVMSALLVTLSLSSAALIAFVLLLPVAVLAHRRNWGIAVVAVVLIGVGVLPATYELVSWRLQDIGRSYDDSLEGRGYDRILNHPEHLILGAGEFESARFDSAYHAELHSTPATLLFSYGLVGTLLFGRFVYRAVHGAVARSALYLIPIAFYGIAHQGLRFSMLWVVLAMITLSRPLTPFGAEPVQQSVALGASRSSGPAGRAVAAPAAR